MNKFCSTYTKSVGFLLLFTAVAKLISITGRQGILGVEDPLLSLTYRQLLSVAGVLELLAAIFIIYGSNPRQKLITINFFSMAFLTYHLGIHFLGKEVTTHCPCLGRVTDQLHISQNLADLFIQFIIVYMFLGSVFLLVTACAKPELAMPASVKPGE